MKKIISLCPRNTKKLETVLKAQKLYIDDIERERLELNDLRFMAPMFVYGSFYDNDKECWFVYTNRERTRTNQIFKNKRRIYGEMLKIANGGRRRNLIHAYTWGKDVN